MKVVFLLGSGASKSSGYPMVDEITKQVLSGEGVIRYTDGAYLLTKDDALARLWGLDGDLLDFVQRLCGLIAPFYRGFKPGREPNYEDLAYVTGQVEDSMMREYENPALEPFIGELGTRFDRERGGIYGLAHEAAAYIRDMVWRLVGGEPRSLSALDWITEACREPGAEVLAIATLNHDRLIDRALTASAVPYSEGFGRSHGELQVWDDFRQVTTPGAARVLRLHGCVDWFRFQIPSPDGHGKSDVIACCRDLDQDHLLDPTGSLIDPPPESRPEFLTGTFTKMLNYGRGIYADTHARLHEALREADLLVVVGYGFGDKGINSRIINWLSAVASRRLCLVHPAPDDLLDRGGRGAVRANLRHWIGVGRVSVVPKKAEDTTWTEIAASIQ